MYLLPVAAMPTLEVLVACGGVNVGRIVRNLAMIQRVVATGENVSSLGRVPVPCTRLATPQGAVLLCPVSADTATRRFENRRSHSICL